MKTKMLYFAGLLFFTLSACVKDVIPENNAGMEATTRAGDEGLFYYYFGEKIYLEQRTDQIFVKLAPNTTKERFQSLALVFSK